MRNERIADRQTSFSEPTCEWSKGGEQRKPEERRRLGDICGLTKTEAIGGRSFSGDRKEPRLEEGLTQGLACFFVDFQGNL